VLRIRREKGFTRPELNEHALRHLKASLPRWLRAGLLVVAHLRDRLSEQAGFAYRSFLKLVDRCARPALPLPIAPRQRDT